MADKTPTALRTGTKASSAGRSEKAARVALVEALREMNRLGINQGTSGNISVRQGDTMLISPSSTPYDTMKPEDVAAMPINGEYGAWEGRLRPSSEWRFHLDIMRARPDAGAVVHCHPTFCTSLAIARKPIPAAHYMVAVFGGVDVRCAPYATFGTKELSEHAIEALRDRNACLLANHGMIVVGPSLTRAMWLAVELETLAKQYWHSLLIGGPVLLGEAEIAETMTRIGNYDLQVEAAPELRRRAS